jgi:transketolase
MSASKTTKSPSMAPYSAIRSEKARKVRGKPACIVANTVKGKGVSYMEDRFEWHGKCPDADQLTCAMKEIWGEDS